MERAEAGKRIWRCGCGRCETYRRQYRGEYWHNVPDVDYICEFTGVNYFKEKKMTSPLVEEAVQIAESVAPQSEVVQDVAALVNTIAAPTPENLLNDLQIAIKLVKKLKDQIKDLHPSISDFIRKLI